MMSSIPFRGRLTPIGALAPVVCAALLCCGCASSPARDTSGVAATAAAAAATAATSAASVNLAPAAATSPPPALAPGAARPIAELSRDRRSRGRRGRSRGPAKALRRRHQGREGSVGIFHPLHQGRQGLAGDQARAIRPAVFFSRLTARRASAIREPFLQPHAALLYRREFHRLGTLVQLIAKNSQFFAAAGTRHARARRSRIDQRQPSFRRARRESGASRAQVDPHRRHFAAAGGHPRRLDRARGRVSRALRLRSAQFELRPRFRTTRRSSRALPYRRTTRSPSFRLRPCPAG